MQGARVLASLRYRFERARRSVEARLRGERDVLALWERYPGATMIPADKFIDNIKVARMADAVPGDLVECGCWRGGMSAALADALPGRRSVLFDSFAGLPPAGTFDGDLAPDWQGTLAAPETAARESMSKSTSSDFSIVPGWFDDTVPRYAAGAPQIAVLRIDGDWYDSTMTCLAHLFPLVAEGGIVILDDYGYWEGCTRAVHDYLAAQRRPEPIRHSRRGVAFLEKGQVMIHDDYSPDGAQ